MATLGVIFTDTAVLADKYRCPRQEVLEIINGYMRGCANRGIEWQLVDVGGHDFDYIFSKGFSEEVSWEDYRQALADNCAGMGWQTDCNTPLFIIGGDDVIPVPIYPYFIPDDKGLNNVEADILYCYPAGFDFKRELDRFDDAGYNKGALYDYFMSKAVFNVSRLPVERGDVNTSVQHDLGGYFERCLASEGKITVDKSLLPVTAFDWYFATLKIIEDIPLLLPLGPINACHMGDVFVSPALDIDNPTALPDFISALGKTDMLLFQLHGSNEHENTGFMGQGVVNGGGYPKAFDIGLLKYCNKTKVFNTLACYGARYTVGYTDRYPEGKKYSRSESMLLSAIYGSQVLLYMGSCLSSWFTPLVLDTNTDVNDVKIIGRSDQWAKTYLNLQLQGDSAGLAMLKSKLLHYDECGNERDFITRLTILEFNQFGDPTLSVRAPHYNPVQAQQPVKSLFRRKAEKVLPHKEAYVPVYTKKTLPELDAAYADVRASVDAALLSLSDDLRRMLADDYHYPSQHLFLSSILREENSGSYLYVYAHENYSDSERRVYVRVDAACKVQNITYRM